VGQGFHVRFGSDYRSPFRTAVPLKTAWKRLFRGDVLSSGPQRTLAGEPAICPPAAPCNPTDDLEPAPVLKSEGSPDSPDILSYSIPTRPYPTFQTRTRDIALVGYRPLSIHD
jgi:hypothetical protein